MMRIRVAAAAALSLAFSASAASQPARMTVTVWSFGFAPNPIHLAAGRPVTIAFQNRSGSSHDFKAPTFFGTSRILAGGAPEGEIDLRPYETKVITLVPRAGMYTAHCSHFLHEQLGMHDAIVVD